MVVIVYIEVTTAEPVSFRSQFHHLTFCNHVRSPVEGETSTSSHHVAHPLLDLQLVGLFDVLLVVAVLVPEAWVVVLSGYQQLYPVRAHGKAYLHEWIMTDAYEISGALAADIAIDEDPLNEEILWQTPHEVAVLLLLVHVIRKAHVARVAIESELNQWGVSGQLGGEALKRREDGQVLR